MYRQWEKTTARDGLHQTGEYKMKKMCGRTANASAPGAAAVHTSNKPGRELATYMGPTLTCARLFGDKGTIRTDESVEKPPQKGSQNMHNTAVKREF